MGTHATDTHTVVYNPSYKFERYTKNVDLPTIGGAYGIEKISEDDSAENIAEAWVAQFGKALSSGKTEEFVACFYEDGFWRDKLAFTWDIRSLHGPDLADAFQQTWSRVSPCTHCKLSTEWPAKLYNPFPDISYVQALFTFETKVASECTGVVNLIKVNGSYKAWTVTTILEELRGFEEKERQWSTDRQFTSWDEQQASRLQDNLKSPTVLIIGAGHNGLTLAARLGALGVSYVVVERNSRIGDSWRGRYQNLSLHDPVYADHLPYMSYPKTWPVFSPAYKVANFLESYVDHMDLHVMLETEASNASWDAKTKQWAVTIQTKGKNRVVVHPHQLVLATGYGSSKKHLPPPVPGQDAFPGKIVHGLAFEGGKEWAGKKALVVGTSSSGFDIVYDLVKEGAEVTMLQRSPTYVMSLKHGIPHMLKPLFWEGGPPTEIADKLYQAFPVPVSKQLNKRNVKIVAEMDKVMLEGIKAKGFRWWPGEEGAGNQLLGLNRGGGFYFDVGGCQLIIDGKVKVQPGSVVAFEKDHAVFSDGTKQPFDVVVFATGFASFKNSVRYLLGDELVNQLQSIWGLDPEGELRGVWRPLEIPNLHVMLGSFLWARQNSKLVARGIVALENGLAEEPLKRPWPIEADPRFV